MGRGECGHEIYDIPGAESAELLEGDDALYFYILDDIDEDSQAYERIVSSEQSGGTGDPVITLQRSVRPRDAGTGGKEQAPAPR